MTTIEVVLLWSFVGLIASMFFALAVASVMGAVRDHDATYGENSGAVEGDQRSFKGAAE